jgi:splicing factor 45
VKSTLADWTAEDDDVNDFYGGGEKRQRGGRKRKKQKKEEYVAVQDWDDIYDPTRPNNYEEYKHSDEKIREVTEWKDRLYAHRRNRKPPSDLDSDEESYRPQMSSMYSDQELAMCANVIQTNSLLLPTTHLRRLLLIPLLGNHLLRIAPL